MPTAQPTLGGERTPLAEPYNIENKQTLERARKRMERAEGIDGVYRTYFEREWFRNVLYFAGKQWIIFDNSSRRWRPKRLPQWYPTPITNKFAEKTNDLISSLMQGRAPINYVPATSDQADIATAEIGARVREVFYEESEVDLWEQELAAWVMLTGNAFLVPTYDYSEEFGTKEVELPEIGCLSCGAKFDALAAEKTENKCPECGSDQLLPTGQTISRSIPIGALRSEVLSPFEIRLDPRIRNIKDHRWFERLSTVDLEQARERWPNFAGQIQADKEDKLSQIYLDALAYVTSTHGSAASFGLSGTTSDTKNPRTTIYEYNELPSLDFPRGLRVVRVGKTGPITELEPAPHKYGAGPRRGQPFLNLVHFGLDIVPGRFWRKSRVDDIVTLQAYRNLIESVLKLTVQRTGNTLWLNPSGSAADNFAGEPGQVIDYVPVSLGGTTFAKPERLPAELSNVQPLVILLTKIDDSIERVVGTFFSGSGDTPPGVTAASALAFLAERADRSISPIRREYAKGWKAWESMNLEIARFHWIDERIRVIAGRNKKWEVDQFSKSNLQGAVNLVIDHKALFPKSQATQRATIAQLIQLGAINPMDPQQQWKILEAFGETALKGSEDLDVQEARQEWEEFLETEGQKLPVLYPLIQNSPVHIMEHSSAAKTDEFKELPPPVQQIWIDHVNAHYVDFISRQTALGSPQTNPNGRTPDGSEGPDTRLSTGTNGAEKPAPIRKGEEAGATDLSTGQPREPLRGNLPTGGG